MTRNSLRWPKIDGFLIALLSVVALAVLLPEIGATGGWLHIEKISTYGISVVFFLYGLTLAPEALRAGASRWQVHVLVQLGTFVLFPAVLFVAGLFIKDSVQPEIWLGFLYIAALPSTVSSSIAMTSLARGNVPVAIFNATLSSMLGVVLTPLLMAWLAGTTGVSLPIGPVIAKVTVLVLVPIIVGQIARHWLGGFAKRHAAVIKFADRGVILAIVYGALCDSIVQGVWARNDAWVIVGIAVASIALFFVVYGLMTVPFRLLKLSREDTIAGLFCASKKSLATGVPLAGVMFGATPALGLIIAPLMIYHFLQLVIVSSLASHYAQREHTQAAPVAS